MPDLDTDRQWEHWGRTSPYFGVLVSPDFRQVERGDDAWTRFMETGHGHVDDLVARLGRLGAPAGFERALDFGCGVGRLLGPLAEHFDDVVGVDVSPSMRAEAVANLDRLGVGNATVLASDDDLTRVSGTFDLVHSFNVLQHIAPRRGLAITRRLLELTRPGGVAVLHYCDHAPALRHRVKRVVGRSPTLVRLGKRVRGSDPDTPIMQMFPYRFADVAQVLRDRGVQRVLLDWHRYKRNTFFQVHAVVPE